MIMDDGQGRFGHVTRFVLAFVWQPFLKFFVHLTFPTVGVPLTRSKSDERPSCAPHGRNANPERTRADLQLRCYCREVSNSGRPIMRVQEFSFPGRYDVYKPRC